MSHRSKPLDGLRGIAILMVVLTHSWIAAGSPTMLIAGLTALDVTFLGDVTFIGVDLFFVLSGYLLFSQYVDRYLANRPQPTYLSFLKRRFSRIAPAYYVLLFVALLVIPISPALRVDSLEGWINALSHLTFTHTLDLKYAFTVPSIWSLGLEFQFYLLLPLIALITLKSKHWKIAVVVLWVASIMLHVVLFILFPPEPVTTLHISLPYRVNEFLSGYVAVVIVHSARSIRLTPYAKRISAAAFVLFIITFVYVLLYGHLYLVGQDKFGWPLWVPMVGICFALLIVTVQVGNSKLVQLFANTHLSELGVVSYGVFLWHRLIMNNIAPLSFIKSINSPFLRIFLIFAITLVLAYIAGKFSYYVIERGYIQQKPPK